MALKGEVLATKQEVADEIIRICDKFGYMNLKVYKENSRFGEYYIHKYFNGIQNACKKLNVNYKRAGKLNKEDISADIMRVYKKFGYMKRELYEENGKYSWCAIRGHYGSFNNMLRELRLPINCYREDYTREEILKKMWELYDEYGYLTAELQRKESGFSQMIIDNTFGGFNNMLTTMGLDLNYSKIEYDELIEELKHAYKTYGYLSRPVIKEMCSISYEACVYRFGSVVEMLEAIDADVEEHIQRTSSQGLLYCKDNISNLLDDNPKMEKTWDWLISPHSSSHMYTDLYYPKHNLVVEYDGEQHYRFVPQWHRTLENFERSKERDGEKDRLLEKHGVNIIRIRYHNLNKESITRKLSKIGLL